LSWQKTRKTIFSFLGNADKIPIAEVTKHHGMNEQSIYSWRKRIGEMETDEIKQLKGLACAQFFVEESRTE
jgi:putative transposase